MRRRPSRARTPEQRIQAQHQFARLEGFGQIIVGAALKSRDPVFGLAARSQHQNRKIVSRAQIGSKIETALARHHDIKHQAIEGDAVISFRAWAASAAAVTRKPLAAR